MVISKQLIYSCGSHCNINYSLLTINYLNPLQKYCFFPNYPKKSPKFHFFYQKICVIEKKAVLLHPLSTRLTF